MSGNWVDSITTINVCPGCGEKSTPIYFNYVKAECSQLRDEDVSFPVLQIKFSHGYNWKKDKPCVCIEQSGGYVVEIPIADAKILSHWAKRRRTKDAKIFSALMDLEAKHNKDIPTISKEWF